MNTRPHPPHLTGYPFRWAAGAVRLACVGPSLRFHFSKFFFFRILLLCFQCLCYVVGLHCINNSPPSVFYYYYG